MVGWLAHARERSGPDLAQQALADVFFCVLFLFSGAVEIRSVVLIYLWLIRVQFLAKKNTSMILGVL